MRHLLIASLLFAALPASAQERNFTVTLPESQWNLIGGKLGKAPYEEVAPTLDAIKGQIGNQVQAANNASLEAVIKQRLEQERKAQAPVNKDDTP